MLEVLKFMFSDLFIWLGFVIPLAMVLNFAFRCWNRFLRHLNVRRAGWPPNHLDADGDWKPEQ